MNNDVHALRHILKSYRTIERIFKAAILGVVCERFSHFLYLKKKGCPDNNVIKDSPPLI